MAPCALTQAPGVLCPKARKCSPSTSTCRPEPSQAEQRSRLTSSLQAMATGGEQLYELELILQGQPPDAPSNYLGVSPPVRSGCYGGAANPFSHVVASSEFSASALNASQSNLQALRELDSQHSFLRCTGDYRLLLGSPDVRAEGWRCLPPTEAPERSSQLPQQPPESRHLHPFTCRAQYFAVR